MVEFAILISSPGSYYGQGITYSSFSEEPIAVSTVEEIEQAVQGLLPEQLAAFRTWFAEFDAAVWERQITADVESGRLDTTVDEALKDLREGRCTEL